jgi:Mrp family chromosome partitioning ATPase
MRRPSAHKLFRLPNRIGLSNALLGEVPWRDVLVRPNDALELYVLPAGPSTRRASDLVGRGLVQLLEEAVLEFDFVILDAPPLLGFAEPLQMATAVDGVVIVTRAGQTTKKGVASVLRTLTRLRANVVGVVLNEVHRHTSDSYYYYGYYGRYYNHYHGRDSQASMGD